MRFHKSKTSADGGFEPSVGSRKGSGRRRGDPSDQRKVHQLCAQVREVLAFALADQWDDPLLEIVSVVAVTPAPDASRLLVTVAVDSQEGPVEAKAIIEALKRIRPDLRHEIAGEIHRKKTPELTFELAPIMPEGFGPVPVES